MSKYFSKILFLCAVFFTTPTFTAEFVPSAPTNLVIAASVPEYLTPSSRVEPDLVYLKSIATNALTGGFGVTGDGVADDTAEIGAAITAALATTTNMWGGYHILYLPGGAAGVKRNYLVNDITVTGQTGLWIIGDGEATILKQATGGYISTFTTCTHIRFSDLAFDANGVTNSFGGMRFYEGTDVVIERAHFYDSASVGFTATNDRFAIVFGGGTATSKDILIQDNLVEDLQVEIDHVERVVVRRNTILRGPTTAALGFFALDVTNGQKFHDITVTDNTIIDAKNIAIDFVVDGVNSQASTWRRLNVSNNRILQRKQGGTAIKFGSANTTWALSPPPIFEDIRVEGNVIEYTDGSIFVEDSAAIVFSSSTNNGFVFNRTTISNNTIRGYMHFGIRVAFLSASFIEMNVIERNSNYPAYFGIYASSNATTAIRGNIVHAANNAYTLESEGAGNTFTGNQYGGWPLTVFVGSGTAPTKVTLPKLRSYLTADLPAGAQCQDGEVTIEDGGGGNVNLVFCYGGLRFRVDGGTAF